MDIFELLRENALADNDLLTRNDARGDLFAKPRDVDFAFKTTDSSRAKDLFEFIKGLNFGAPQLKTDGGLHWLTVVIHMPITQPVLCSVSGFMVCLSRLFGVEYDGWGSVIQHD